MTASVPAPQALGATITFTAASTGCAAAEYRFWVLPPGGSWTATAAYGGAGWAWSTSGLVSGTYQVGVWARQSGSGVAYEAYGITTFALGVGGCVNAALMPGT